MNEAPSAEEDKDLCPTCGIAPGRSHASFMCRMSAQERYALWLQQEANVYRGTKADK